MQNGDTVTLKHYVGDPSQHADRISGGKLVDVDPRPLEGIPPTDWSMNDKEASEWS